MDWYVFVFTATEFDGELIDSPEGKLEWIDDSRLLELNLWPSDLIFLPWLERGKFFSAKFVYEGDEFKSHEVMYYSWMCFIARLREALYNDIGEIASRGLAMTGRTLAV